MVIQPGFAVGAAVAVCAWGTASQAQTVITHYTPGESFGYVIESRVIMGEGEILYTERAETRHDVVEGPYLPGSDIRFTRLTRTDAQGMVTDLGETARAMEPWLVSLEAMGGVPFPLEIAPELTGVLGDLQNFHRAAHPAFGAHRIETVYDSFANGEAHSRTWSSPDGAARGGNCLTATVQLTRLTDETALFRAVFSAPETARIDMPDPAFDPGVAGTTPNNYYLVFPGSGQGLVNLLTGRETNTVHVTLDRATGRILSGELRQVLHVQVTSDCPADFSCTPGYPTEFSRETTLTLLPG